MHHDVESLYIGGQKNVKILGSAESSLVDKPKRRQLLHRFERQENVDRDDAQVELVKLYNGIFALQ